VSWDAERQRFLCPCHGGTYARDGAVVSGPPPRGLAKIPVRVEKGQLKIRLEEPA
jgi:cytochrome b6-f complex iron-sulfur subunit